MCEASSQAAQAFILCSNQMSLLVELWANSRRNHSPPPGNRGNIEPLDRWMRCTPVSSESYR